MVLIAGAPSLRVGATGGDGFKVARLPLNLGPRSEFLSRANTKTPVSIQDHNSDLGSSSLIPISEL